MHGLAVAGQRYAADSAANLIHELAINCNYTVESEWLITQ